MKMYLEFRVLKLKSPSEADIEKKLKCVVVTQEEKIIDDLKQLINVNLKSFIEIEEKLINKTILAEVDQIIVGNNNFDRKEYYRIKSYKVVG